jgi:hypothetical protein
MNGVRQFVGNLGKTPPNYGRRGNCSLRRHSRTGHETFTSSGSSVKQARVMSTLSDGLHHGSDREARPGWRACCRCGCRPGGELRGGLLTEVQSAKHTAAFLSFQQCYNPLGFGWVSP